MVASLNSTHLSKREYQTCGRSDYSIKAVEGHYQFLGVRTLFETWEQIGNVTEACRVARVGHRTFYYWKPRFDAHGYTGLASFASSAPKHPHRVASTVRDQVIALRQANPEWGKRRIAQELAKAHQWQPVVSPNTVKRILIDAFLWPLAPVAKKGASLPASAPPTYPPKP
jgi:hypothetical protein